jgi:hypothetical protein
MSSRGGVRIYRALANYPFPSAKSTGNDGEVPAMTCRPLKTACELLDMIVERAGTLHGPWPAGLTLFVFEDAYGWTASISRPASEGDNFYRIRTLDLITTMRATYDLNAPRLSGAEEIW